MEASEKPPKKRKKGWIVFIVILIPILAFLARQGRAFIGGPPGREGAEGGNPEEEVVYAVNTAFSRVGEMKEFLSINGDIIALNTVNAYPDTAGRISSLTVEVGDLITKDEIIAWVDPSKPGMNFVRSPVKAPIGGTVTAVLSKAGKAAAGQVPILTIGDLSRLQARAYIPERFTSRIVLGMPTSLTFETFPGRTFNARVSEISPVVDPATRSMEIKMDIHGPRGGIKVGMFAEIELLLETKKDAVQVPAGAVVNRFGTDYLFILNPDETVSLVPVVTGIIVEGRMEILEGLEADREIVYRGMTQLEDGSKVRVIRQLESQE